VIAATIVAVLFFYIGIPFGFAGGVALTRGGLEAALAMAVAAFIVAAIAGALAIAGGVALAFKATRPIGKISLVAAAAVVAGAVAAAVAVPVLGLRYEPPAFEPVYTTTDGTVRLTLAGEPEFVAGSGRGGCSWSTDGGAFASVGAPDAGSLRGRTLSAQVRPEPELGGTWIYLSIQGDGLNDLGLPTWTGMVAMTSTDGGHAGSVSFDNLPVEAQKPGYEPDDSWPRTLTGTLTWTCD
jgi:hypothetical protein